MTQHCCRFSANNDETHIPYREEVAQLAEWCGANNLSLSVEKTKEVVLDFRRRNSIDTHHWPSTARLWRESAALNSWGCTSRRISPGPPTPCHSPRRHNSTYTFSASWKEQVSHHPSSPHSTGAPLRASWRTPPTPPTVSSSSYHQEDGTGTSEPAPPGCSTAFSPRLWEPWTQITPPSSKKIHANPYLLKHGPPPPPPSLSLSKHPPTLPHQRKNCVNFFVQFKCATHRWVGLYKPPVVTHSPLCALDTFSHTAVKK